MPPGAALACVASLPPRLPLRLVGPVAAGALAETGFPLFPFEHRWFAFLFPKTILLGEGVAVSQLSDP